MKTAKQPEETALARMEDAPMAKVQEPEPRIGDLAAMLVERGITTETAAALDALRQMQNDQRDREARLAFNAAFVAMQSEIPVVKALVEVPNNNGSLRFRHAPESLIMQQVQPFVRKYGFALHFSTRVDGNRLVGMCSLIHKGGHERTNEYAVRIGSGPPGSSESQADASAYSYAQRGAVCDALGIVVDRTSDARDIGPSITVDQAEDFRQRVKDTGSKEAAFLKFAGATTYEDIPENRWQELDTMLRKKERGA